MKTMLKIIASVFFIASMAVAQSTTQVSVYHYSSPACNLILSFLFQSACVPNVTVRAISTDLNVIGYLVVIKYTDTTTGKQASAIQTTVTRENSASQGFLCSFPGTEHGTNISAWAFPLVSAGADTTGFVLNVP